jgi:hypothetical protein
MNAHRETRLFLDVANQPKKYNSNHLIDTPKTDF